MMHDMFEHNARQGRDRERGRDRAGAVLSLLKLNIYVCMEYIDWEDLLFFCLLLAQKDTECSTC